MVSGCYVSKAAVLRFALQNEISLSLLALIKTEPKKKVPASGVVDSHRWSVNRWPPLPKYQRVQAYAIGGVAISSESCW